jgi:hypothetical protein
MELSVEYRDIRIEIESRRQHVGMVRRGSRCVLVAPPGGTARLTQEQVNRILEEVRDERLTTSSLPRR